MSDPRDARQLVVARLTMIFQDVFDDPRLVLSDGLTAKERTT